MHKRKASEPMPCKQVESTSGIQEEKKDVPTTGIVKKRKRNQGIPVGTLVTMTNGCHGYVIAGGHGYYTIRIQNKNKTYVMKARTCDIRISTARIKAIEPTPVMAKFTAEEIDVAQTLVWLESMF